MNTKLEVIERFVEQKEMLKKTHPLRYLFWEATVRCNLDCLHCGSDCMKDNSTKFDELDIDLVKKELKKIAEFYNPQNITLAIIGGEPLLRDEIYDVGSYAANMGYR